MPDKDTTSPDHTDWSELRQLLLDLLSEYQAFDKPGNPELLKLHIEAYEDKILALFKQYAQSPVVADNLDPGVQDGVQDVEIDEILDKFTCSEHVLPADGCIGCDPKAALLQREQRLVAEARIDELGRAYPEMMKHRGLYGEGNYYYDDRIAQLRHNTNTGKGE